MAGDDQSAWRGVKLFGPFEDFHRGSGSRQKRCGKETGSGATDDCDLSAGLIFVFLFDRRLQCDLPAPQSSVASQASHRHGSASRNQTSIAAYWGRPPGPVLVRPRIAKGDLTRAQEIRRNELAV